MSEVLTGVIFQDLMKELIDTVKGSRKIIFPKFVDVFFHTDEFTTTSKIFDVKNPNITIKNNLNEEQRLMTITGNINAAFKTQGNLKIQVSKGKILDIEAGNILNSNVLLIDLLPFGMQFKKDDIIKFWIFNNDDATSISINIGVLTGKLE